MTTLCTSCADELGAPEKIDVFLGECEICKINGVCTEVTE